MIKGKRCYLLQKIATFIQDEENEFKNDEKSLMHLFFEFYNNLKENTYYISYKIEISSFNKCKKMINNNIQEFKSISEVIRRKMQVYFFYEFPFTPYNTKLILKNHEYYFCLLLQVNDYEQQLHTIATRIVKSNNPESNNNVLVRIKKIYFFCI